MDIGVVRQGLTITSYKIGVLMPSPFISIMRANTYSITTNTALEAAALAEYCAAHGITMEQKEAPVITVSAPMSEEYLKPSKPMKVFCGPHWANRDGLVQPKAALGLVINTIQRCNLKMSNDIVCLNEALQHALTTELNSVLVSDLPDLVNACFTPS